MEQYCCFIHKSLLFFVPGVFSAARDLKMEWIVIRGISGYADGTEANINWQTFASVTAACLVVSSLNQSDLFKDWPHYQGKRFRPTAYLLAVIS